MADLVSVLLKCAEIKSALEAPATNRRSCDRFRGRVGGFEANLRARDRSGKKPSAAEQRTLRAAHAMLVEAHAFVAQFARKGRFALLDKAKKVWSGEDDAKHFAEFNERLNRLSLDLSLALAVDAAALAAAQRREDAADAAADLRALEAALAEGRAEGREQHDEQMAALAEVRRVLGSGGAIALVALAHTLSDYGRQACALSADELRPELDALNETVGAALHDGDAGMAFGVTLPVMGIHAVDGQGPGEGGAHRADGAAVEDHPRRCRAGREMSRRMIAGQAGRRRRHAGGGGTDEIDQTAPGGIDDGAGKIIE